MRRSITTGVGVHLSHMQEVGLYLAEPEGPNSQLPAFHQRERRRPSPQEPSLIAG